MRKKTFVCLFVLIAVTWLSGCAALQQRDVPVLKSKQDFKWQLHNGNEMLELDLVCWFRDYTDEKDSIWKFFESIKEHAFQRGWKQYFGPKETVFSQGVKYFVKLMPELAEESYAFIIMREVWWKSSIIYHIDSTLFYKKRFSEVKAEGAEKIISIINGDIENRTKFDRNEKGIVTPCLTLLGEDFSYISDDQLQDLARTVKAYGRVTDIEKIYVWIKDRNPGYLVQRNKEFNTAPVWMGFTGKFEMLAERANDDISLPPRSENPFSKQPGKSIIWSLRDQLRERLSDYYRKYHSK